ncbi:MAG: response regulator [Desulfosarcina sp.]|nr:response regulator [Desulfosarcina sp.]
MGKRNTILIAERNPNIRRFLRRELSAGGYHVFNAENAKDLMKLIYGRSRIDLLVLDPDFPGMEAIETAGKIANRIPQLPVVLFSIRGNDDISAFKAGNIFLVEKNGQSIDILKAVIQDILKDTGSRAPSSLKLKR